MNIALDYDGTYTEASELFNALVYMARAAGHEIFIVTMRYEEEAIEMDWVALCK